MQAKQRRLKMISSKPKVLIVDDEQVVCDLLSDELHEQGYLCSIALGGTEALAKLAAEDFDVVLLDVRLPDISGIEVLTKMRLKHPHIAAVMVTAVNSIDTAVKATKLGASDYIVKPFSLDRVDASIRTILESKTRPSDNGKRETGCCVADEEADEQATNESYRLMNAIACGVEARLNSFLGYSKIVTQESVGIAWQLGVHEEEIKRWAAIRSKHDAERNKAIESLLDKLARSPLAQSIIGMAVPLISRPKLSEYHN
jgi:CheY-like chemotaxis protein